MTDFERGTSEREQSILETQKAGPWAIRVGDIPDVATGDRGTENASTSPEIEVEPAQLNESSSPRSIRELWRRNGPRWILRTARQVIQARVRLRKCTSVGKWVRLRGKVRVRNGGTIIIQDRVRFYSEQAVSELVTWNGGTIEIGEGTGLNYGTSISAASRVTIGRDCLIGTYVSIMDCNFHNVQDRSWSLDAAPIVIGNRVWLANRCMIMPGVTIGDGAAIAAGSLVTRDVPPNAVAVGVPARIVKQL